MEKLISIKEARIKKGLSINDLSKALKLDIEIIRLLDDNLNLPKKFKAYEPTYKKSIYRYLGYEVKYKNSLRNLPDDHTKISLTYFLLLLIFAILTFLSEASIPVTSAPSLHIGSESNPPPQPISKILMPVRGLSFFFNLKLLII